MKDLIITALNDAYIKFEKSIPQTKKQEKLISIIGVSPLDIVDFMKQNDIPMDASFGGRENGYDAWDDICLVWNIDVPTTNNDKLKYSKHAFKNYAFQSVKNLLLENNYKITSYCTSKLKEFEYATVYGMYMDKDFDRLVKYYSLPFTKID